MHKLKTKNVNLFASQMFERCFRACKCVWKLKIQNFK